MNDLRGKKLDHFFRQELADHEHPFDENHWQALENRLKRRKRNRLIGWIVTSGVAAMLLAAMTTALLLNQTTEQGQQVVKSKQSPGPEQPAQKPEPFASQDLNALQKNHSRQARSASERRFVPLTEDQGESERPASYAGQTLDLVPSLKGAQAPVEPGAAVLAQVPVAVEVKSATTSPTSPASEKPAFKPGLSFSIFAGPDINGVNNLRNTGNGLSGGVALTYQIVPRLSISAGVAYAKKLYSTEFANYKPNTSYTFPANPSLVDADCRVLDLPVNINYRVWKKKSNAIQVTAGLSSYLMLKEEYYFDYKYNTQGGPSHYETRNKNKHYLGVVNLSAGYEKALSKDLSVGVSPYLKLPITDIGYGNVRLESAGITTNLRFNLGGLKANKK